MKGLKTLLKFIILGGFVAAIVFGIKYINRKTFDYTDTIRTGLNRYNITGDKKDLYAIVELMDDYEDDREYISKMEDYASKEIQKLYDYVNGKYLCDKNNLNACNQALEEMKTLVDRVEVLYAYKSGDGSDIINPSKYQSIKREGENRIKAIESVIKSYASKNALNSEEIRLQRCENATDCNCSNNNQTCQCSYSTQHVKIGIVCKNKDYVPKQ